MSTALAAQPVVVKAIPDDGQRDVDPAKVRELRIVFDQPMDTRGGWSIVGGGETFPKFIGKPRWIDGKTLVWPMRLEPGRDYWLSINSETFTNFRSAAGESAVPYPISFTTAGKPSADAPALSVEDNKQAIEVLRRAIDEDYSYRDLHNIDWNARFTQFQAKLESAQTPEAFAREAANLLRENRDLHVWLKAGEKSLPSHRPQYERNYNMMTLRRTLKLTSRDDQVFTAKLDGGIDYILIASWDPAKEPAMDAAYEVLASAKKLIVDVRPNGGGDELMAQRFAGCFIDAEKVYSKNTIRRGGEFVGPFDRTVAPNKSRPAYRGPVALLIGPGNFSSNESFILMMRQNTNCTLVGSSTYGASGNPKPHELGNGVVVYLSSWQDMLPDGTLLEGKGITPDVEVKTTAAELAQRDAVLERAMALLGGGK